MTEIENTISLGEQRRDQIRGETRLTAKKFRVLSVRILI